jgi:K+-sensing histidine kinase KdpD
VPEELRGQIFQRFGRGVVPEHDEGFGLGLSIVRAIADAHGGTVHVEDAEPRGARFVITLPSAGSPSTPAMSQQPPADGEPPDDEVGLREELSLWQGS